MVLDGTQYMTILAGTWSVFISYKLVLLGIRWNRVSKGLVCLYTLEKVETWSGVTDASHLTDNNIVLLSLYTV